MSIYKNLLDKKSKNKKSIAVLIDPDKYSIEKLSELAKKIENSKVDYVFVGGSLLFTEIEKTINQIKLYTQKPVIIFPGNVLQVSNNADAILLLSLISGRNPDLLIGNHVVSAPFLKKSNLEIISTGYLLIDGNKRTSVEYVSNTKPIPNDKADIAVATAMAGEMIGMKLIYLEAGSGAKNHVDFSIIKQVKSNVELPIIVGGGLRDKATIEKMFENGADIIVLGSIIEEEMDFIYKL